MIKVLQRLVTPGQGDHKEMRANRSQRITHHDPRFLGDFSEPSERYRRMTASISWNPGSLDAPYEERWAAIRRELWQLTEDFHSLVQR